MARNSLRTALLLLALFLLVPAAAFAASAKTSMRLLYPSFAGSWATAWIAKEAGYFLDEGLDVELIRVGGSTRMVAAMLGGSALHCRWRRCCDYRRHRYGFTVSLDGTTRDRAAGRLEREKGGYHYLRV